MDPPPEDPPCSKAYKAAVHERHSMVDASVHEDHSMVDADGSGTGHAQQGLHELFVDLVMVQRWPSDEAELAFFLKTKGGLHQEKLKRPDSQGDSISIEGLFQAQQGEKVPKTVLVEGIPGIGKTFTMQKVITDWASNRTYNQIFQFVFYVACRDVASCQQDVSLNDVLFSDFKELSQTLKEALLAQPEKVLLILDGLDHVDRSDGQTCQDVAFDTKLPPRLLLGQVLERKVLPEASLLITTRPGTLACLDAIDRHVTILGFSQEGQRQYFSKFFRSECLAAVAMDCLRRDQDLIALCFIPLFCHLACRSLLLGSDSVQRQDTTMQLLTSFYSRLLGRTPLDSHHARCLTGLALHGIKQRKVIFDDQDLKSHDVPVTPPTCCFLNKVPSTGLQSGPRYSFGHLTLQELLAAVHCVSSLDVEEPMQVLEDVLSSKERRSNLMNCEFDLMMHHIPIQPLLDEIPDETHLLAMVRFMFGLLKGNSTAALGLSPNPQLQKRLLDWIQKALAKQISDEEVRLLLYGCLYEIQDDSFVRQALKEKDWFYIHGCRSRPVDYAVASYCLLRCEGMTSLCLSKCRLGIQGLKALLSVLPDCSSLWHNKLTDDCMAALSPALQEMKNLKILDIQHNCFQDGSVPGLLGTLQRCRGLERLVLASNQLGDKGVKLLSEGLKRHGSNLQVLWLSDNGLTDACAQDLVIALQANPSLSVDLSRNSFSDQSIPSFLPVIKNLWSDFPEWNKFSPEGKERLKSAARKAQEQERSREMGAQLVKFFKGLKGPHH
ncbi:NACHT, LRR and PYD domains-containing protein 3-like isoform X2 [Lissotriton helveticus]